MDPAESKRPIIVKKVKKGRHDFHGGSWKVAFADFATAMMAFFLLLWLMGNTDQEQKQAISGYFNDPAGTSATPGSKSIPIGEGGANDAIINLKDPKITEDDIEDLAEQQERERLNQLQTQLEELVDTSDAFAAFKEQIIIDITPNGLRIQIVDKDKRPMFDSGSSELKVYSRRILYGLADVLKKVPNKLSITGHTDATPFDLGNYGNWELSADRANAARRALTRGGIPGEKIARVEGFADSVLFDKEHPTSPINRRIAIIVLKQNISDAIEEAAGQFTDED
ncbi:flagellar motor protein MotB [Pleionea sediminis]|uniref:flagellar motor protein MotB n=1 Tax=Pleionea sediminis TaxID=2569479 RepID=UPI0011865371|nr:flagellar motor protein MotB [Pleionea sediminis]